MLRHNIIKMKKFKDKKRILKATKERKVVTYQEAPIKLSTDFLTERFQTRRDWHKIFKLIKNMD